MANGKKTLMRWQTRLSKFCKKQEYFHTKPSIADLKKKPYKCPLCRKYHIADC